VAELEAVAARLLELGVTCELALASPLARARETAAVLARAGVAAAVEEADFLAPGGRIEELRSWLASWRRTHRGPLALVGHQPSLGDWTEMLVSGEARGNLPLKKAGMAAVELPDSGSPLGRSRLRWLVSPKLLLHR